MMKKQIIILIAIAFSSLLLLGFCDYFNLLTFFGSNPSKTSANCKVLPSKFEYLNGFVVEFLDVLNGLATLGVCVAGATLIIFAIIFLSWLSNSSHTLKNII